MNDREGCKALRVTQKAFEGETERLGLKSEADVVNMVKEIRRDRNSETLSYDEWFIDKVNRGLESAKNEPLHDHDDVMREIEALIESKASHEKTL